MIYLYHNPRCSKSRETLALIEQLAQERQLPINVIDYLKTPLTADQIGQLLDELQGDVQAMLRPNEDEYTALHLAHADRARAIEALVAHPKIMQRPIVSFQGKAAIGRPPEHVLTLFKESI